MGVYQPSRNIERSCMQAIRTILINNSYTNVNVVKSMKQVYDMPFDPKLKQAAICVKCSNTVHQNWELGSLLTQRKPLIIISIFGSNEGQILDLKDVLITNLKNGFDYYTYTILGGTTSDATYESGATADGKINVETILDLEVNLSEEKSNLNIRDRHRWQINLSCSKSKLEA